MQLFWLHHRYRVLVFVITYLLPTVCMAYWNFRIAVVLTTSTVLVSGDSDTRNNLQLSVLVKKRKVGYSTKPNHLRLNELRHQSCLYRIWLVACGPFWSSSACVGCPIRRT
jgi:hypothetical protein